MMGPPILHRLFKIFNMKTYCTIVGFFIVYLLNAQAVLPHALLINNNAYPSTITANTAFNFESATSGLTANTYPADSRTTAKRPAWWAAAIPCLCANCGSVS